MGSFLGIIYFAAIKDQSASKTMKVPRYSEGGGQVHYFYSDSAGEVAQAADELGWIRPTSSPYHPQPNGKIGRQIRILLTGTSASVLQARMVYRFWLI